MAKRRPQSKQGLIAALARQMGVDPKAALAIASVEGGFGGAIGDQGTSFGPFQLHKGGALPSGVSNPQAWANSPSGIRYALAQISKVAKGLQGRAAVTAIARDFERPADIPGEIAKAMSRYGNVGGGGGGIQQMGLAPRSFQMESPMPYSSSTVTNPEYQRARRHALTQAIMSGGDIVSALGSVNVPRTMRVARPPTLQPMGRAMPQSLGQVGNANPGKGFSPRELFYDPLGAWDNGQRIAPIGGHSDHVHAAFDSAQQVLRAIRVAQALGLRVSENPRVDRVDPVHTKGSFHYQTFPGTNIGKAIDVSGTPQAMSTLFRRLSPRKR